MINNSKKRIPKRNSLISMEIYKKKKLMLMIKYA